MTMRSRSARMASKDSGDRGRIGGQRGLDFAGRGARHDGALGDGGAIVGDPVDNLVAEAAELFGGHRISLLK